MKALVKVRPGSDGMAYMDVPEPRAARGQITIKVQAGGICGTDIHIMKDEFACNYPVIMGHEYAGVVAEVGSDVDGFQVGDRVISMTRTVHCGQCRYCHDGLIMLCPHSKSIGYGVNGAFAEYVAVPAKLAFKIPDRLSLEEAAVCEPLACAVHGLLERGQVTAGDHVLVCGPGIIGMMAAEVAIIAGATVTIAGTRADMDRLGFAAGLGCHTIMADEEDALERCVDITEGQGFDVVVECAGAASSAAFCLQSVRKGGLYVQMGLFAKQIEFNFNLAVVKEITIVFDYGHKWSSWSRAVQLLRNGQIDLKPYISGRYALRDWRQAFDQVLARQGFKVLLLP